MLQVLAAFVAAFGLLGSVRGQVPAEREESCGSLLTSVISVCSQPALGRPDWCCNELKRWNDARCWCEPNAFDALDTVSATGHAFSFRDTYCREPFQRPNRGSILPEYATCDAFPSVAESDPMEECPSGTDPSSLRIQRIASLKALRTDAVADKSDLSSWFSRMDALFTDDATYENVGIFLGRGRFEVKQYLMTRQEAYGLLGNTLDFTGEHFWRSPRMVSYMGGTNTRDGLFNRREFVTFERCGARIKAVHSLEDNYQRRYWQIWDAKETRLLRGYDRKARKWCADIAERCTGSTYPFDDGDECEKFYRKLRKQGRMTCNRFSQAYVPQYAIHGDTIACRTLYLDLASVDPAGACAAVGKKVTQGRCQEEQCPGKSFIDPFDRDATQIQFEGMNGVTCSDTSCRENWPSAEQILSIPKSEGMEIEAEEDVEDVAIGARGVPRGPPQQEEATQQEIASDADSGIDVEFENDVAPRTDPVSPTQTFLVDPIAA